MVDGRFELLEPLGSGGMGTVWRAYDLALHREVALKEVRATDDGTAGSTGVQRKRVLREARALARIGHPNVVAIHHIVDSPATVHPWIVMELVRGRGLADQLALGPMEPARAAQIGRGVLAALRAAHAVGVLHRDIKPANVLLREDGSPVLTDFGIAAIDGLNGLTSTGSVVGSLDYVAPERLDGQEGHPASDLWSLGLLLYVAVEGYHPLRRDTTVGTLAAVLKGEVPPPRRAGALTALLQALLVTDPNRRPAAEQVDRMLAEASGAVVAPPYTAAAGSPPIEPAHISASQPVTHAHSPVSQSMTHARRSAPQPITHTPPPWPPTPPGRNHRWTAAGVASAVLIAVVVAAVALRPDSTGSQANPTQSAGTSQPLSANPSPSSERPSGTTAATGSAAPAAVELLTPDGIRQAIAAFETASGGKEFTSASFHQTHASTGAPIDTESGRYDNYTYRDGVATRQGPGGTLTGGDTTIQLSSIDWDILPELFRTADEKLGVPNATTRYVLVDPAWTFNNNRPTIKVYLSDDYGGTAYLAADTDGTVVKIYARER
ncbi:serine/threonine protein kinase [Nocardia uniformis]|uniref:non-specific serine/threonine protein kinase n=1 Tax=Nocardia uniformis TaxID=53432 RepID=A0A849BZU9_9NOCA|nr:serine/threonine protein kinase [Nocardia uniformis]